MSITLRRVLLHILFKYPHGGEDKQTWFAPISKVASKGDNSTLIAKAYQ